VRIMKLRNVLSRARMRIHVVSDIRDISQQVKSRGLLGGTILSSFYVPLFEKLLAEGTIVEYEIDREIFHNTDSRAQLHFSFVTFLAAGRYHNR
jgi:hypothetical protein